MMDIDSGGGRVLVQNSSDAGIDLDPDSGVILT
jgi:hypothetical protein